MKRWPTRHGRPIRRATFGHAATLDYALDDMRRRIRASELGELDYILHQRPACPYRPGGAAAAAYALGYSRQLAKQPRPNHGPLPDLPRARGPLGRFRNAK